MDKLAQEIIGRILSFLPPTDLLTCTLVCKAWLVEADGIMSRTGFLINVPQDIRQELEMSEDPMAKGKAISGWVGDIAVSLKIPQGIIYRLGQPCLSPVYDYSIKHAMSLITVGCHPRRVLRLPPPSILSTPFNHRMNHHPAYILHPISRGVFLSPVDDPEDIAEIYEPINEDSDEGELELRGVTEPIFFDDAADRERDDAWQPAPDVDDHINPIIADMYFEIQLDKRLSIHPTGYSLRHHSTEFHAPRNWTLLASQELEGDNWDVVRAHVDDETIPIMPGQVGLWLLRVDPEKRYRRFRILKTGPSGDGPGCHYFHISGLEMYGTLFVERAP